MNTLNDEPANQSSDAASPILNFVEANTIQALVGTVVEQSPRCNLAHEYKIIFQQQAQVLATVLFYQEREVNEHLAILKIQNKLRDGLNAAELQLLPAPIPAQSPDEFYGRVTDINQTLSKLNFRIAEILKTLERVGLIIEVYRFDSSGDRYLNGYRIPIDRIQGVVQFVEKWGPCGTTK